MARRPEGSLELRGSTWSLRRWVAIVNPRTGQLERKYRREELGSSSELRTRAAARAAADAWIERTRLEPVAPGPQLMAVSYLEYFQRIHLPFMRPSSQAIYRGILAKHVAPAVAGHKLVDLDTAWLVGFMAKRAPTMERKTLANIRTVLLQVLRQAVRDRYGACRIDPREVKLPRVCRPQKPQRYFTAPQLERIIGASAAPWSTLWTLMGYAGLRAGEALALEWQDIDFEQRLVTVRQNAVRGRLGAPKTKTSAAAVPMLPQVEQALRVHRAGLAGAEPAGLLFHSRRGTPLRSDDVRRRQLYPLLDRLGLPRTGLHAFRHSLARILVQNGVAPQTVRKILRHGSLTQTQTYTHWETDDTWRDLAARGLAGKVAA